MADPLPAGLELLGRVSVRDVGAAVECDYGSVVETAKDRARRMGGNVLRITWEKRPSGVSVCYQMEADVLFMPDLDLLPDMLREARRNMPRPPVQEAVAEAPAATVAPAAERAGSPWKFGVNIGPSIRTGKAAEGAEDLAKDLRLGVTYGADLQYFFPKSSFGLGARLAFHHYSAYFEMIDYRVRTTYLAPSFMWRNFNSLGDAVMFGFSVGYLNYHDSMGGVPFMSGGVSRESLMTTLDAGYDIRIKNSKTFVTMRLSIAVGNVDMSDVQENARESLNAVDITMGIRF